MGDRQRLLRSAALTFGAAFALRAVEHAFRLSEVLSHRHVTASVVVEGMAILQFLVLSAATLFAAQAFASSAEKRAQGLRDAAVLAAASYGFGLLSAGFAAGLDFSEPHTDSYRVAAVLEGVFVAGLAIAAILAAIGFSRPERARRDRLLAWTGIAFLAANLVGLTAGLLRAEGYTYLNGFGTLTFGLDLGTTGFLAAAIAGAIASFAFFDAGRVEGSAKDSVARRDLLLAAAAGAYVIFAAVLFVSEVVVAIANSGLGYSGSEAAPTWFVGLGAFAACAAGVCVMAALQPAFARALQRLRTTGPSGSPV